MVIQKSQNSIVKNVYFDTVIDVEDAVDVTALFDQLAKRAAAMIGYSPSLMCQRLNTQKNRDTAAIGNGVALPHLQVKGLKAPITIVMRLPEAAHFENAIDNKPVDLICLVLSPARIGPMHLLRLSKTTRLLKQDGVAALMRETEDPMVLMNVLNNPDGWVMAA